MKLIERQMRDEAEQDAKLLALQELGRFKCDRCGEHRAAPPAPVPDVFSDRFLDVCDDCAGDLIRLEVKLHV